MRVQYRLVVNSPVVMFSLTQNTAPKIKKNKTVLKSLVRIALCYKPYYLLCGKRNVYSFEKGKITPTMVLFRKCVPTFLHRITKMTIGDRKNIFTTEPKICAGCF
jgi:hypothetical protein